MGQGKVTAEGELAGKRIRHACKIADHGPIDRKELARRTKIGYSTLGNYEQGTRRLPIRAAKQIEKATGVPAAYLLGLIDEQDMELLRAPRGVRQALLQLLRTSSGAPPPNQPPPPPPAADPFPAAPAKSKVRRATAF